RSWDGLAVITGCGGGEIMFGRRDRTAWCSVLHAIDDHLSRGIEAGHRDKTVFVDAGLHADLGDDVVSANDINIGASLVALHRGVRQSQLLPRAAEWNSCADKQARQQNVAVVIEHGADLEGAGGWVQAGGDIIDFTGMWIVRFRLQSDENR